MSTETLKLILTWGLPPLLGAIIGFITNAIAIRMLFRPLRPVYIFKLKLPFTPGVIPRQREQLAESIGNMVHRNLITVDTLYHHLNRPEIKNGILQNISALSAEIADKPVSELDKTQLNLFYASLEEFLAQTLHKLFTSENFRGLLKKGLKSILSSLASRKVDAIIEKTNIREILISYVLPFLTGNEMKKLISREVNGWLEKKMEKNTPLNEIIPEGFVKVLTGIFHSFLPDLLSALFSWLRSPEIRHLLETQGRVLLKNILDKLNVMQKFFLSVAQYDKTLENSMPEIVEDALNSFEQGACDKDNQETFIQSVEGGIIKWEENGMSDLIGADNEELKEKLTALVEKFFIAIGDENAKKYITGVIDDFLTANKDKTLGGILEDDFKTNLDKVENFAYDHITGYLSDPASVDKLSLAIVKMIIDLLNNMKNISLTRLFNLDADSKQKIDNFILNKIYEVIEHKLPGVVESFNVKALVVNKINSLNIEDVERLLMMVIEKHLKWINVFGALLGALIGFSQVFMRFF